jgi:hypothetical protein
MYNLLNIFLWLNRITGSLLDGYATATLRRIRQAQAAGSMVRVTALIERLVNLTSLAERAEAQASCALVLYQMGEYNRAAELLDQARMGFTDDEHKQAVVCWMTGIVQLQMPSQREAMIANWTTAIRLFRQIEQSRFHPAKRPDPLWHGARIPDMEAALETLIQNEPI